MGAYEKCPKQYYYRYIEKPKIEQKEWIHLILGTFAHRVLELFHEILINEVRDPKEYSEIMSMCSKNAYAELSKNDKTIIAPALEDVKGMLQDYLDRLRVTGLPPVIAVEKTFKFRVGNYLVRGILDRTDRVSPGEYHVVDYKTSKNPKYLKPFQLMLYGLALQELYDDVKLIHGSYSLLRHKSELKGWTFDEKDLVKTRNKILKFGDNISTDTEWKKKPNILCNWCDYQNICQNSWTKESKS